MECGDIRDLSMGGLKNTGLKIIQLDVKKVKHLRIGLGKILPSEKKEQRLIIR